MSGNVFVTEDRSSKYEGDIHGGASDARIIHQLAFMGEQLQKTRALLEELTETLNPVMIPNEAMASDIGMNISAIPRKISSEISNLIDDHNSQISLIQSRINNITQRLQL